MTFLKENPTFELYVLSVERLNVRKSVLLKNPSAKIPNVQVTLLALKSAWVSLAV